MTGGLEEIERGAEMGGKRPRQKGDRLEYSLVNILRAHDLEAKRVPLSGSAAGYKGDVICRLPNNQTLVIEAKARATGFKQLYGWLDGEADLLVLKADRQEALAVVPLRLFCQLLADRGEVRDE